MERPNQEAPVHVLATTVTITSHLGGSYGSPRWVLPPRPACLVQAAFSMAGMRVLALSLVPTFLVPLFLIFHVICIAQPQKQLQHFAI